MVKTSFFGQFGKNNFGFQGFCVKISPQDSGIKFFDSFTRLKELFLKTQQVAC